MHRPWARLEFEDYFASETMERTVEESMEESSAKSLGSDHGRTLSNAALGLWLILCQSLRSGLRRSGNDGLRQCRGAASQRLGRLGQHAKYVDYSSKI